MRTDAASADCTKEQNVFMSHQLCRDHDLIPHRLISSDEHELRLSTQQATTLKYSMLNIEMTSPVLMTKPYTYPVERQAASFHGKQNTKTSCTKL